MLGEREQQRLLEQGAGSSLGFDRSTCMHEVFTQQALRSPGAVAIRFGAEQASYAEIDSRSNRLAQELHARGVEPETLVGLYLERGIELLVAVLGILKSGGAYVPLDPAYPSDRVAFMLEDTDARLIVSQEKLLGSLPGEARTLCIDRDAETIAAHPDALPQTGVRAENLGYIIYTSGSTGRPKGVALEHRQAVQLYEWARTELSQAELSGVLFSTSICFDLSIFEMLLALGSGGTLVMVENLLALDSLPDDAGVTLVNTVPSVLAELVKGRELPSSVRTVTTGGEALPTALVDRLFEMPGIENVIELYGPSETTTYSTFHRRSPGEAPCIGRPLSEVTCYVLDEHQQLVEAGATGELYHGGECVARGYWRRPELSAQRFLEDPFVASLGRPPYEPAHMYRSGDLVRWRTDGELEFVGRADHQVKIRGFRVELGEIESVLEEWDAVGQAVVLAREDGEGQRRLVAYVVPQSQAEISLHALRAQLGRRLPDYMLPAAVVSLLQMPLTANGKTDRKALPAPSRERPDLEQAYVKPHGPLEEFLCAAWERLLQIDGIGAQDRFFDLGGSSLLAAEFIRGLESELRANIYIVSIFDSPTLRDYARFLERDYAGVLEKRFGAAPSRAARAKNQPIGAADVAAMEACIYQLSPEAPPEPETARNPQAVFVLAPPRSGTTLLRVMLAGHPDLFAGAELQLLGFHTLQERKQAFRGKFALWLEGTIRALMELRGCTPGEAEREMERYEAQGFTTRQMYALLQREIAPRVLVDKSPSYALDPAALEKAERDFERPLYIHLVRHPEAMIQSFTKYHMEQVLFLGDHPFTPRQLAELTWLVSHENTLRFLEGVPVDRCFRLRYEDLVTHPEPVLRELCAALGMDYHPDLADPYKDIETKMVDGIYDVSAPMGDTNLLSHGRIDPSVAESWKKSVSGEPLCEATWALAEPFGYERPEPTSPPADAQARRRKASRGGLAKRRSQRRDRGGARG